MARMLRGAIVLLLCACGIARADLRTFSSRHYQVHTDLEPGLAQDLARRMDAMYDEYTRRLISFDVKSDAKPVDAYLFKSQSDYLQFAGSSLKNTGGIYIPSRNALAAFHDGQGRDSLRRTLQHEAFHQFAANTIRHPLPMWVNEGIAQYFEEGLWTGDGFTLGQVPPRRVRQLSSDMKDNRLNAFEKFLKMGSEQWAQALNTRAQTKGATQYNQAWAMVHFLANASDAAGQPKYRARLVEMLKLIHDGVGADQAFTTAFSANYQGFRDRFNEWVPTLKETTEATYIERQEVLADMLSAMGDYGKRFTDIDDFRDAVSKAQLTIQYSKGLIHWASEKNTDIYFSRINGDVFDDSELYLQARRSSPYPDIVCVCLPNTVLRTRFYKAGGKVEHELLFEPANTQPPMASPLIR